MGVVHWYLGFGASESLFQMNKDYRASVETGKDKDQIRLLQDLLVSFTDECLDQYFLRPIEKIKINGVGRKVILGGVAVIKKTIHVTLKSVVKKLSPEDRLKIADYIDGLLIPLRSSSYFPTYVAVRIEDGLRNKLALAVDEAKVDGSGSINKGYTEALCELIEVAIDGYINEPLRILKLGVVMRKVASVASDTIKSSAQSVVKKVIPSMSETEMLGFFEFTESILYPYSK